MTITLEKGNHEEAMRQVCIMEATAVLAGEEFGDHPPCVCPALISAGIGLNDAFPSDLRQKLLPYAERVIGTNDDGYLQRRGLMAADWLIRVYTPTWLELAGITEHAQALKSLGEIVSWDHVEQAQAKLDAARDAAGAAAWDAARDAAWDAAWDAARDAAGAAAWGAARDAAGAAARAAARAAAWDAARGAARDAAGAAARAAAGKKLAPTVTELQLSGLDLYDRMVSLGEADRDNSRADWKRLEKFVGAA